MPYVFAYSRHKHRIRCYYCGVLFVYPLTLLNHYQIHHPRASLWRTSLANTHQIPFAPAPRLSLNFPYGGPR